MTWESLKFFVFLTLVVVCILTDLTWWIPAALFYGALRVEVKS